MLEKEKYPQHINSEIKMTEPNEEIQICRGLLTLKNDKDEIQVDGEIVYKWFPSIGAKFTGFSVSGNHKLYNNQGNFSLIFDSEVLGEVFITDIISFSNSINKETKVSGVFTNKVIVGDKNTKIEEILFSIPNFKNFLGDLTSFNDGKGVTRSRLSFENENYKICIDKSLDYDNKLRKLKNKGGFFILYNGALNLKKGTFSNDQVQNIFNCFDLFITFLMGRRTSTIFHSGYANKEKIWVDYSEKKNLIFKETESWTLRNSIQGIQDLFIEFSNLWNNENNKDFLNTVIHWYVEANNNSGYIEGSIIMAQTALELLYNWLLIEKKQLIAGNDANNISASNKIRLLLSEIKVDKSIPKTLNNLIELVNSNNEYKNCDAPEIIVQIRNAIIHSQLKKREKLSKINSQAKNEALKLFIQYIELSILYILKYKGKFTDRCSNQQYHKDREVNVPWI